MSLEWNETETVFWTNQYESPSEAIVTAIAAKESVTETSLPPLYNRIDPDALDTLVAGQTNDDIQISFTYSGYTVRIRDSETIEITPT
ncbi:hypothetical protein HISP_19815 (plasmid) [Haloarcula hispanica N601]|uniref:Halobacterial output domain-containing protein n=3 Tax=Haloarcula hispanica TaxID=51589 RepID=A0A482SY56_HALHI|nr:MULTISPECIES: HalOD1 output domain-containing protein [Haloarcula]AEM59461.1 conserved hypothetical protein [Haloarcula hispanica ATCC 33960]AHB68307.1 hypothetical protein HISP_19815 [Haloarcula hispanica N601]AJF27696.1 hypothetical protein SG26_18220 [Haloarcula sp. CBA1115]KAA9404335.1 hypothetical protein Har1131_16180 [Haloarcula sp. CBA1131]KAA9404970.1 hypothetical protein EGO51_16675 [Haloarcula hispanica]